MNKFIEAMAIVGGITTLIVVIFLSLMAFLWIGDFIERQKYAYKVKHRFDKPPKAKCYCIDCAFRDEKTYCKVHKSYTADNYFCRTGIPRRKEEVKKDG